MSGLEDVNPALGEFLRDMFTVELGPMKCEALPRPDNEDQVTVRWSVTAYLRDRLITRETP